MGFNSHAANVVAAFYIATGQDPAHVVEASSAITVVEKSSKSLYINVHLPGVMVGVVGGGTVAPTQREALRITGVNNCKTGVRSQALSEVLGGAVLAGELSLLASLAEGSLARSHNRLRRKDEA